MTREDLFDVLRPLVLGTGVPEVVLYDEDADSPPGEYASIEPFRTTDSRGQGGLTLSDLSAGNLNATVRRVLEVTSEINFYRGSDPQAFAQALIGINEIPDISATLFKNGVRWVGAGPARDLTGILGGGFRNEKRARIEIRLMLENKVSAEVPAILSDGGLKVDDESGRVLIDQEE